MELNNFNFNGDETLVIINTQHKLKPQQEELLLERYNTFMRFDIPEEGLNEEEIKLLVPKLIEAKNLVIASPIPYLLKLLGKELNKHNREYFIFHNDIREKEEINMPDGSRKIIFKVSDVGWKIL